MSYTLHILVVSKNVFYTTQFLTSALCAFRGNTLSVEETPFTVTYITHQRRRDSSPLVNDGDYENEFSVHGEGRRRGPYHRMHLDLGQDRIVTAVKFCPRRTGGSEFDPVSISVGGQPCTTDFRASHASGQARDPPRRVNSWFIHSY